jgi:hypothetical protein
MIQHHVNKMVNKKTSFENLMKNEFLLYLIRENNDSLPSNLLEEVSEDKDLGVVWQKNLKWNFHVNRSCPMAYMKLGILK